MISHRFLLDIVRLVTQTYCLWPIFLYREAIAILIAFRRKVIVALAYNVYANLFISLSFEAIRIFVCNTTDTFVPVLEFACGRRIVSRKLLHGGLARIPGDEFGPAHARLTVDIGEPLRMSGGSLIKISTLVKLSLSNFSLEFFHRRFNNFLCKILREKPYFRLEVYDWCKRRIEMTSRTFFLE